MARLTRLSTGKLYGLDDFSTPPFDVYTNGWTLAYGTVAIESGQLSCLASGGSYYGGVYAKATYSGNLVFGGKVTVTAGRIQALWRVVGTNFYRFYIAGNGTGVTASVSRYDAAVETPLDTATVDCVLGVQYNWKIVHDTDTGAIEIYWGDVSILTGTDDTYTSGMLYLRGYDPTANTAHVHYDDIYICTANTIAVQGLADGWDAVCGGEVGVASGGTATVDMLEVALPQSSIKVRDGSDVDQETFTSANDVWGGDAFQWATVKVVTETLNITEGSLRRRAIRRVVNETLNITEGIVRRRTLRRIVAEALNITEGVSRPITRAQPFSETAKGTSIWVETAKGSPAGSETAKGTTAWTPS
jgi:hypothetical protein